MRIKSNKAQLTLFIILAAAIVLGVGIYFLVASDSSPSGTPKNLQPIFNFFENCVSEKTRVAANIMGSQAGWIESPGFEAGNAYRPFSSHLSFQGAGIPYWSWISASNTAKERIPTIDGMEKQLENYLNEEIKQCDFAQYRQQGFVIDLGEPKADVTIEDNKILVDVRADLAASYGEDSASRGSHSVEVANKLGKFYNLAKEIYAREKASNFLENYAVDVLRLYAPVDGVEITCAPKVWNPSEINEEVRRAMEGNVQAIRLKGDYYSLKNNEEKYFIQNIETDESVNFLYDRRWPYRFEVWPAESGLMMAEPVGLQEGLGILGFCYVPYHFVYDFDFPVLIQIYDGKELFQFPVAVVIEGTQPRAAGAATNIEENEADICGEKNSQLDVYTYDNDLNPVKARISFNCLNDQCEIGESDGSLNANVPQCFNAVIRAEAEGYVSNTEIVSTINPASVNIILEKEYEMGVELNADNAIVMFESDKGSRTIVYPQQKTVKLTAGLYNVSVKAFANISLRFPESTSHKCVEVASPGLFGMLGAKTEKCFDITTPSQEVTTALTGGGKEIYFLNEEDLRNSNKIVLKIEKIPLPTTIDEIAKGYEAIETKSLDLKLE